MRGSVLASAVVLLSMGIACASTTGKLTPSGEPVTLNGYSAASLIQAFGELGKAFEQRHPAVNVLFNSTSSQRLAQQIVLGANADVFASRNQAQMDVVISQGLAVDRDVRVFATNRIVVVFPLSNSGGVKDLEDLARSGLKVVLPAPEVPAGAYALSFLEGAEASPEFGVDFRQGVMSNVVSHEENVKAVLSKVESGEADAGIAYTSDAAGASDGGTRDIPPELNPTAVCPIVALQGSPHRDPAQTFVEFVLSPVAQSSLARHGFAAGRG
jgi:molybdate transport system substrate-binding protein